MHIHLRQFSKQCFGLNQYRITGGLTKKAKKEKKAFRFQNRIDIHYFQQMQGHQAAVCRTDKHFAPQPVYPVSERSKWFNINARDATYL